MYLLPLAGSQQDAFASYSIFQKSVLATTRDSAVGAKTLLSDEAISLNGVPGAGVYSQRQHGQRHNAAVPARETPLPADCRFE